MRKFEFVGKLYRKHEALQVELPKRGSAHSAGYDFFNPIDVEIPPKTIWVVWTDIKAKMAEDEVLMLYVRSSMAIKRGIILANGTGIIDSDYYENQDNDGNIGIALYNMGEKTVLLKQGERIAQGIFTKYLSVEDEIPSTQRVGGMGSTGK